MNRIQASVYTALTAQIIQLECEIKAIEGVLENSTWDTGIRTWFAIRLGTLDRIKVRREEVTE